MSIVFINTLRILYLLRGMLYQNNWLQSFHGRSIKKNDNITIFSVVEKIVLKFLYLLLDISKLKTDVDNNG